MQEAPNPLRLIELAVDPMCITDMDGEFEFVNPAFESVLGHGRDELLAGASLFSWVHVDDLDATESELQQLNVGLRTLHFTNRWRCKGGDYKSIEWSATPELQERRIYLTGRDVTDQRKYDRLARFSVENTPDAVLWVAPNGSITHANAQAGELLSMTQMELLIMSIWDIDPSMAGDTWPQTWEAIKCGEQVKFESVFHDRCGRTIPVDVAANYLLFDEQEHLCVFVRDVTARRVVQVALERLARRDDLTGLLNRWATFEELRKAISHSRRYARPLSVLLLDLDHFKQINDIHGHPVGDVVLANTGRLISSKTRISDFAGRIGGEEFCIGLPETSAAGALVLAERLRFAVAKQEFRGRAGENFTISCSIGISEWDGDSVDELMRRVDDALYRAKHSGRNRCIVQPA